MPINENTTTQPVSNVCRRCGTATETLTQIYPRSNPYHNGFTREQLRASYLWCNACCSTHSFRCRDCRVRQVRNFQHWSDGICYECESNWRHCYVCNDVIRASESHYCSYHDESYCESCWQDHDCEDNRSTSRILEYDDKPRPRFFGDAKFRRYGIELETDVQNKPRDARRVLDSFGTDHAYLKSDGTIAYGFEIVTHPHTVALHRALWQDFFTWASRDGFNADGNGMHVHMERRKLTPYRIAMMQSFLNTPANESFVVEIAGRRSDRWAKLQPHLSKMSRYEGSQDRYQALNLTNRDTAEMRIFKGTLDPHRFFANLEFCDALCDWTARVSYQSLTVDNFLAHVRNSHTWTDLDAFLVSKTYLPRASKPNLQGGNR